MTASGAPRGASPIAGKYRLLRRLASGGMGEVYLAEAAGPEGFAKLAVLKRILPHFAGDPAFRGMFINEAKLAAALDHPNIVRVYDFGRAGDSYFYAMEYLHGASLAELLPLAAQTPERIPLEHAIAVAQGISAGLDFAHNKRAVDGSPLHIVHRDVSPANIFVTYAGEVKLLDFGIAKALAATGVTAQGTRKGKVAYMSPEQCIGAPLDQRSDVFAIGVILYEMTTVTRLFRADNEFATMNMITSGLVPPPAERSPGYPEALAAIVLKSLARERDDRHASARALLLDLERFAGDRGLRTSATALGEWVRALTDDRPYPTSQVATIGESLGDAPRFFTPDEDAVTFSDGPALDPDPDTAVRAGAGLGRRRLLLAAAGGAAATLGGLAWLLRGDDEAPAEDDPAAVAGATTTAVDTDTSDGSTGAATDVSTDTATDAGATTTGEPLPAEDAARAPAQEKEKAPKKRRRPSKKRRKTKSASGGGLDDLVPKG